MKERGAISFLDQSYYEWGRLTRGAKKLAKISVEVACPDLGPRYVVALQCVYALVVRYTAQRR